MINVSKTIKNWRETHKLSQQALAKAVFCDPMTISHYELEKRVPNLEMLEKIANVFGYTLDFTLVKKVESNIDENFYHNNKTANEILIMNNEDLAQYIYVTQDNDILCKICNIDSVLINILSLEQLKELVLQRVSTSDRLSIYYKLNNLYPLHEDEMADFVNYIHYHLAEASEINHELLVKVKYILVETINTRYGYEFSHIALLDENKEDLGVDIDAINGDDLTIDSELPDSLGEYLNGRYSNTIELYLN